MSVDLAILIGNSKYDHLQNLPACIADVERMKSLLSATARFASISTFIDEDVTVVTDSLRELLGTETQYGELFVYFTGHGISNQDDFYMCFQKFDEKFPNTTGLSRDDLLEIIRGSNPEVSVFVVDACEAGRNLIKGESHPVLRQPKSGLKSFLQFSSCAETQSSFASRDESFFTREFVNACLIKETGAVYYSDIENALRDHFLNNAEQTPYFIKQSNSREKFCVDARNLEKLRSKAVTTIEVEEPEGLETTLSALQIAKTKLDEIDQVVPTKKEAQEFIDTVVHTLLNSEDLNSEITDFYDPRSVLHDDFDAVQNKRSVVRLLARRKGYDHFVEGEEERVKRTDLLGQFSVLASLSMGQDAYDTKYELWNRCELKSVHVGLYFEPKHMAMSRVFAEILFLPRLTECLILKTNNLQKRSGWDSFDEWSGPKSWSYSVHKWSDDPAEVGKEYTTQPFEFARKHILTFSGGE